ncbi:O-antigen polysaccharide polymerase Wzy [Desulfogranum mediterraneum]|uniref:O-antigen polysaccharide polymerase Wzy n=1 Tax=Desulfogranum mediterraneum TaxID=160661 RepID=UPI00040A9F54|nr:O-antigen polysaccharide polymerase Wzy [Desulfogranum mediterraneum]
MFGILLFIEIVIYFFLTPEGYSRLFVAFQIIVVGVSIFLFLSSFFKKKQSSWLLPTIIFLLGFIIVNFQLYLVFVLWGSPVKSYHDWFYWADFKVFSKCVTISTVALLSFFQGYKVKWDFKVTFPEIIKYSFATPNITILLFLAYAFYILFFFTAGVKYRSGAYAAGDAQVISRYFFMLFNMLVIACFANKFYFLRLKYDRRVSVVKYCRELGAPLAFLVAWHMLYSLYVGDRGPFISYCLLFGGVYFARFRKVTFVHFIAVLIPAAILMTAIGDIRSRDASNIGFTNRLLTQLKGGSESGDHLQNTAELAGSVRVLHHIVSSVPSKYPYKYGEGQFRQFIGWVPFFSSNYLALRYGDNFHFKHKSSSNFATFLIQGDYPTYGNGTSAVADLYLDLGLLGVIVGMILFGYFMKKVDRTVISSQPVNFIMIIFTCTYFFSALYLGRATILTPVKITMQIFLICIINFILIKKLARR